MPRSGTGATSFPNKMERPGASRGRGGTTANRTPERTSLFHRSLCTCSQFTDSSLLAKNAYAPRQTVDPIVSPTAPPPAPTVTDASSVPE